jgi:hypothetical protein
MAVSELLGSDGLEDMFVSGGVVSMVNQTVDEPVFPLGSVA